MSVVELTAEGYRSIKKIRLKLDRLNLLVGPNGCGKTNLYRTMYLISQAATGDFAKELAREGGMRSALWAGAFSKHDEPVLRFAVKLDDEVNDLEYEIKCGRVVRSAIKEDLLGEQFQDDPMKLFNNDPHIREEAVKLTYRGKTSTILSRKAGLINAVNADGRKVQFPMNLSESESVLFGLREPQKYPELATLREELLSWRFYHQFRTDLDSPLRQPHPAVTTHVLSHDGHDFGSALATICGTGDSDLLHASINEAFPGSSLVLDTEDDCLVVKMQMPGFERSFELAELSDGTLQYLCLLAALLSTRPPALLALNEPETSLHVNLLVPLAKLIVNASKHSQLWITTHSPELASAVKKYGGVSPIVLQKTKGQTTVVRGEDGVREDDED